MKKEKIIEFSENLTGNKTRQENVQNIIKVVSFGIELRNEIIEALDDNKVTLFEGLGFIDNIIEMIKLVKDIRNIFESYKELTSAEKAEISQFFINNFEMKNQLTESTIEKIFALLLNLNTIINI